VFTDQELWYCHAGLWPLVERLLKEAGYEIDARRVHGPPLPKACRVQREEDWPVDNALLRCVRQQDRAVVRYTPGKVKPAWLITQIARGWPERTLVIVTTRTDDTLDMAKQLRRYGLDVTYATRGHYPDEIGRVLVATESFLSGHPEVQTRDIAVFLDDAEAFSSKGLEVGKFAYDARVYGFLADYAKPEPFIRDHIAALFAFEEVRIPEHGRVLQPVEVVSVAYKGGVPPESAEKKTAFTVKRDCIWRNNGRNQFIARLCRGIVDGDTDGLKLPNRLMELINGTIRPKTGSYGPKIGIIVDNVDHALALAGVLQEVAICMSKDVNRFGLSKKQESQLPEEEGDDWKVCISTFAGLAELPRVNVLIRADGGMGVPEALINVYVSKPSLVVDVCDRHHPLLRLWQRQRHEEYERLGWNIHGKGPMDPVRAFMSTRPEVKRR